MVQALLLAGSIISFIVGSLIFLVGIGAVAGCVGGILSIMVGGMLSIVGLCATISFFIPRPDELSLNSAIDLIKHNGKWIAKDFG